MKRCRDCGLEKPLADFSPDKKRRDGRTSYCRECFNERHRRSRLARASAEGRTIRQRLPAPIGHRRCPACGETKPLEDFPRNRSARLGRGGYCKPCHNAIGREAKKRLYGSTREYHLRRRYGIGQAEFAAMVEAQGGTCAVCSGKPEHVDHDHLTGEVRGVLCFLCNQALGNVRDDAAVLYGLIRYLDQHRPFGLQVFRFPDLRIEIELPDHHVA